MALMFNPMMKMEGEMRCWSLLGFKGLNHQSTSEESHCDLIFSTSVTT